MRFCTAKPKTVDLFIGRLREVEKIAIRGASSDRLEHLRQTDFLVDGPLSSEDMIDVQRRLVADFSAAGNTGFGETWKI